MSLIFFQPIGDDVECQIYSDEGEMLATHRMTLEGARIRRSDFESAIYDASWARDLTETLAALGLES